MDMGKLGLLNKFVKPRKGLPHLKSKLLRGEPATIAFLGGSITEGAGASDPDGTSWRVRTGQYLQARYGERQIRCINAGVGGTTSTFGAYRLQSHVLSEGDIDLLFVEFSVNDGEDRDISIRGMEGIVRQCRQRSSQTELCFIYAAADKNLSASLPFNISVHEEVAAHYGIPSVNFAAVVYERIQEGATTWASLAPDRIHPNDEGHALYADYLQAYLAVMLQEGNQAAPDLLRAGTTMVLRNENEIDTDTDTDTDTDRKGGIPAELPEPLDAWNDANAQMRSVQDVADLQGFQLQRLSGEPLMNWRYDTEHLYTDSEGAAFSFTVTGQRAGVVLLCGPDSGIFEYALNDGAFTRVNLFDEWCLLAFRPVLALLPAQPEWGSIRVTIRHTGMKDERSKGTKIRVLKLLSC